MSRISLAQIDTKSTSIADSSTQTAAQTEVSIKRIEGCDPPEGYVIRPFNPVPNPANWDDMGVWRQLSACINVAPPTVGPNIFWFGCTDAIISEVHSTLTLPGGIITHRNFGNLFQNNDYSVKAALADAFANNSEMRVVVVGHTTCRAIKLAIQLADPEQSLVDVPPDVRTWIDPLVQLAAVSKETDPAKLASLNVQVQSKALRDYLNSNSGGVRNAVMISSEVRNDSTGGWEG